MTTQTQASIDITAVIKQIIAAHTAYPLAVEQQNMGTVDQATQVDPYLKVEIRFLGADQIELGEKNQLVQQWGQVWLTAICKPGAGTAQVKALLDFVTPYFDCKRVGVVQCRAVTAADGKEVKGLWREPAIVNFYYYRRT